MNNPEISQTSGIENSLRSLEALCLEVRRGAFEVVSQADNGHLGSCSSSTELMVALYFGGILRYDSANPRHPDRDRVLVRGHVGPLRYKIFSLLGWIDEDELPSYRQLGSRLQGHEAMDVVPGVDITPSGSLGMVLSYGVGSAITAKSGGKDFKTFVFLGDGEEQEGNVSEAARHAANQKLDNLICILDKNGGQLGHRTHTVDGATDIQKVWEGYGWNVVTIKDGNNIEEVVAKLKSAQNSLLGRPTFVIANTVKGVHIPGAEDNFCGYHTLHSCPPELLDKAINLQNTKLEALGYSSGKIKEVARQLMPQNLLPLGTCSEAVTKQINILSHPDHNTHLVDGLIYYFGLLANEFKTDQRLRLYALTADLIRETQVEEYGFVNPAVYIDTGIREQHMLAMAHGISVTDPTSRIAIKAGDAFFYRSSDQLNAIAQAGSRMVIVTDDGGLSGARNGSTHQSSGQPGALLSMPGVQFYEPADVRDLYNCLNTAFTCYDKPTYIRVHSRTTPLLPRLDKDMHSTTYYQFGNVVETADITLISAGLASQGALEAQLLLGRQGVNARLINIIDPNSLDERFTDLVEDRVPVLTVYNGNESILRQAVAGAIMRYDHNRPSRILGHGFNLGTTGKLDDLIRHFQFDGAGIVEVLKKNNLV